MSAIAVVDVLFSYLFLSFQLSFSIRGMATLHDTTRVLTRVPGETDRVVFKGMAYVVVVDPLEYLIWFHSWRCDCGWLWLLRAAVVDNLYLVSNFGHTGIDVNCTLSYGCPCQCCVGSNSDDTLPWFVQNIPLQRHRVQICFTNHTPSHLLATQW